LILLVTTQAIHFSNAKRAIPSPQRGEGIARFVGNTDLGLSSYFYCFNDFALNDLAFNNLGRPFQGVFHDKTRLV
jgi:hypothetical protein